MTPEPLVRVAPRGTRLANRRTSAPPRGIRRGYVTRLRMVNPVSKVGSPNRSTPSHLWGFLAFLPLSGVVPGRASTEAIQQGQKTLSLLESFGRFQVDALHIFRPKLEDEFASR